jgi:hypothetical protein
MRWLRTLRLILLAGLLSTLAAAQDSPAAVPNPSPKKIPSTLTNAIPDTLPNNDPTDDPNDAPLGDVARSLRKRTPSSQVVVDDDNLSSVMQQAESRHAPGSALRFLMAGEGRGFRVSAPDVTCSLAFTANVKALLSNQYAQMELPPDEMRKLEGPATIEGDALILALYNRTDWHVSEVAVALTVVKKSGARDVVGQALAESEAGAEKNPDVTTIYRMRAAAPPSATTVFSAPLNLELDSDEEWHWAIVQARGYPPQSYAGTRPEVAPQSSVPVPEQSMLSPTPSTTQATPRNSTAVSLSQSPQ